MVSASTWTACWLIVAVIKFSAPVWATKYTVPTFRMKLSAGAK
jgi:hypothetical protein